MFLVCGVIYIVFGIIGKISAVFICIPYPVLGGALITLYGMFTGKENIFSIKRPLECVFVVSATQMCQSVCTYAKSEQHLGLAWFNSLRSS